ncbi:MAG: right-handed parallel beta-helix repeat-containing protein, partial [Candidatus Paceibacterota bacterium]
MGKQLGVGRVGITFLVSVFMAAVLIGGFIFVGTASAAGPWYVDGSVGASGDGLSEAEAFKTIAEAVTAATAGDTINILAGTYEEAVQLSSGLQGGLSIIGAGVDNTIIVGGIRTRANNSISISNLTVDGGYDWGDDGNGDPAIWVENGTSGHAFSNIKLVGPGYGPGVSKRGLEFSPSVSSVSISFLETYGWNSGIFLTGSNHVLSGLNVHDNNAGVGSSGISNVSIISSIFADNNEGFGADTVGVGVSVTGSSFVNNGTGVGHYGGNPISALGNFWGDATGPKNSVVNPDASGSLVTSNVTFSPWLDAAGGSEKSHNVEIVGGGTFNSISGALASASAGNVINILAGVYTPSSTIVLDKSVTLQGAQAGIDPRPNFGSLRVASSSAETILDGRGTLANILRISADAVVIDGFEIRHGTGDLVDSLDSGLVKQNPIIRNNIIHNSSADEGIQIRRTNNAIVEKNHVFATAGDGINSCCNTTSATIRFNEVHNISSPDAAIYAYDTVDTNIEGNLVYDVLSNDGIKLGDKNGSDANKSGGSIVNNIIHDTEQDGISVYQSGVLVQGNEVYNSSSENGAIHVAFAVSDIQILDNYVHDNILKTSKFINSAGILIRDTVNVASVSFSNNRLENNAPFSLANHKAGELVAKNNWWGVGNPKFADILSGSISFSPWLDAPNGNPRDFNVLIDANNNGTRDDGESTFDSIQDAIDAAVAGDKILVGSGVYTDSVTDGKGVIIQSVSGAANTEIVGRVTLNSNGAKINGFSINNPADNFGILINGINNVEVINNVVSHIGTSAPSANVWAIWYQDGAIDSDNIKIQNNAVSSVGNTGNNASNGAIGIGDSTGNSNITGVVISGNNISTVSSAKGAYGILLGHARHNSPSNMGSVTGAQVLNNTISGLTGGWAHGIGLEGDTPSAVVTGNHLSNFTTTPTPTNSAAVKVEDNPSGGTVSLSNNRFETGAIRWGVNNVASGVLVNATN